MLFVKYCSTDVLHKSDEVDETEIDEGMLVLFIFHAVFV